ncbi:MAG: manganese-dependent inorganic pyrophosphatase [Candidatus Pacearchaeota archaeon]|nr:manganese-dependent inorganic pyrophosphatase [Candidatus Pacearchaeota archaeon]
MKYVFGHTKPDTDSVLSAILYANFLNEKGVQAKAIKLGEINNETKFILEKFGIEVPETIERLEENSEAILVDHNEEKQTISNIGELNIDTIIDHHRFDLKTEKPVNIRAEKLGSTCSILYKIFKENNYKISTKEACLILSGIISDTLYFRSPTTTEEDKRICEELKTISEIEDLEKYSLEMFNAKSDLGDIHAEKLVKMDYKEFEFNEEKYGVGVIETTNPDYVFSRKEEIVNALNKIKQEDGLKGILVSVIDILNEHNKTIVADEHEAEILRAVFQGKEIEHNVYSLGSVLSRKKQIIPKLEKHFE